MQDASPPPTPVPPCPGCSATHVVRNGHNRSGSANFLCRGCGRQFVARPRKGPVPDDTKDLVRRLLRERMALRAIARSVGVSRSWAASVRQRPVPGRDAVGAGAAQKKSGDRIVEADELGSFVGSKGERWWVWAALDADTRQVVAMVAGDRSEATAQCLWDALPDEDREGAILCTDFWAAYAAVVPADRHAAGGKDAGLTCHIERFWCTLRQRCGRFVRKTLSFSKCPLNHVGALWYFIRYYNASLL